MVEEREVKTLARAGFRDIPEYNGDASRNSADPSRNYSPDQIWCQRHVLELPVIAGGLSTGGLKPSR
jgi:hypothetical protein